MESNEHLTAAEWYDFLINEVKVSPIAKDVIEKLVITPDHHYITKEGFINLSVDDLVNIVSDNYN
jgi:hypothetical protein